MTLERIMQSAYSGLVLLCSVPVGLVFRFHSRGKIRLAERFGNWKVNLSGCVWLHGASMGEIRGLLPVIAMLQQQFPHVPLLLTSTSPTGLNLLEGKAGIVAKLLPFDSVPLIQRALRFVRPRLLVITETELWPSLLSVLSDRDVPCILINARVSDYSFPRYRLVRPLMKAVMKKFVRILATTTQSRERLIALGARPDQVIVVGNSKFDVSQADTGTSKDLRNTFFSNANPVVVLGSMRPGEEDWWFPAMKEALDSGAKVNFIVAPRHQEKFEYFMQALSAHHIGFRRRSDKNAPVEGQVVVLDSMGELGAVYAFATLAFVGGTLLDFGGHNPLEAAAHGVGVVHGPYLKNISDIIERLHADGGAEVIESRSHLSSLLQRVSQSDESIARLGRQARLVWEKERGATARIMETIGPYCG